VPKPEKIVMLLRVLILTAAGCLAAATSHAANNCQSALQGYRDCVRLVDSLRPDKAGQARVFAIDGSEFTAGQAQWMKGQLRKVDRLCARGGPGDQEEAARVLAAVRELLRSHHRAS
jgi:hypothetical protein